MSAPTGGHRGALLARVAAALTAVALLALVGCGIPTDGEPRLLADESVTTTGVDADPAGSTNVVSVFLVTQQNALVPAQRALTGARSPSSVLDALLASRTDDEQARGLTTRIPAGTTRLAADLDANGLVTVNLSEEWQTLGEPFITTAYAQVVFTLTELTGVDQVRFQVDGTDVQAQTPIQGPLDVVTAADYPALAPDEGTTSTTEAGG